MRYFLLLFLFLFAYDVHASDEESYLLLRKSYRKLVLEDPRASNVDRWKLLHEDFSTFIDRVRSNSDLSAKSFYLRGRLAEELCNIRVEEYCRDARVDFQLLVSRFPDSDLADDALLALARLKKELGDDYGQQVYLHQIVRDYPGSNSADLAQLLLERLPTVPASLATLDNAPQQDAVPVLPPEVPIVLSEIEARLPVVLIDPGHGGDELGAHGPKGIFEKDIALAISKKVRDLLLKENEVRVELSRNRDVHLELSERTDRANEVEADLFVSIHANASPYKTSRGVETYYLDNTNDKSSLKLAERENFTVGAVANDLSFIVSDFIQGVKAADSITAAHRIQSALVAALRQDFSGIKNLGVKKAPFFVLVGAHMPCVLVEVSFIDNPIEGRRLATDEYQNAVARGIVDGIKDFLSEKGRL